MTSAYPYRVESCRGVRVNDRERDALRQYRPPGVRRELRSALCADSKVRAEPSVAPLEVDDTVVELFVDDCLDRSDEWCRTGRSA